MPSIVEDGRDELIYKLWLKEKNMAKVGRLFRLTRAMTSIIIKQQKVIHSSKKKGSRNV